MLDINFIRDNEDIIQSAADKKGVDIDVKKLIKLDDQRRELIQEVETMRAKQNEVTEEIAGMESEEEKMERIADMKELKDEIQANQEKLDEVMKEWQKMMLHVPNIPDMEVPVGEDDEDNKEIKTWGDPTYLRSPKNHVKLMEALGMLDLKRGVKVSGFRGYFLKGDGVLLNMAIWNFVRDQLLEEDEFTPLMAPSLVRKEPFVGTGYLPQSEDDLYKTQDDLYLSGTSEVPVMGYYMDETLKKDDLPVKFLAFSPCYRREAGSHGKDTKGLMRVHEFYKLEQVVLCEATHQESVDRHEELLEQAENIMQRLGIPYRVVVNCTGDLGLGQVKKYDIEAWVPSENRYRETHSCSYFHDFQTRRLNIKYKDGDTKRYVHSLNSTAIATPRILISVVENNQQDDGSIVIPEALQPYMKKAIIE